MQVPFRRPVAPPLLPPPLLLPVGVQEARQIPQGPGVRRKEHDGISPSYTGKNKNKNIYNAQNQTVSEEAAEARGPRCFQGLIFFLHPFFGRIWQGNKV